MTPTNAQVLGVTIFDKVTRRRDWLWMKYVADAAKDIAAIVKRNDLDVWRGRDACFQIHHHHGVAANRDRERIHPNQVAVRLSKNTDGNNHLTWSRFFITKTP